MRVYILMFYHVTRRSCKKHLYSSNRPLRISHGEMEITMGSEEIRLYKGVYYKAGRDAKLVMDEEAKIDIVKSKMDFDDPKQVLSIYNTVVSGDVFHSPVGFSFLAAVREYLLKNEIEEDEIRNVVMKQIFSPGLLEENEKKRKEKEAKKEKNYKIHLKQSLWVNLALILLVVVMFIISMTSDSPTILDYKTKLNNSYAQREQELKDREEMVRQKENELIKQGITLEISE